MLSGKTCYVNFGDHCFYIKVLGRTVFLECLLFLCHLPLLSPGGGVSWKGLTGLVCVPIF